MTSPDGDLTFTDDDTLTGTHRGSVLVKAGTLNVHGIIQGSLHLAPRAAAVIHNHHQGSVHLSAESVVTVHGILSGSAHLEPDATLVVEQGGRHAGSLHNDGTVIVRGSFGGSRLGSGEFRLEGSGYVKQPVVRDGINYYEW